jgi:hypothetical protein
VNTRPSEIQSLIQSDKLDIEAEIIRLLSKKTGKPQGSLGWLQETVSNCVDYVIQGTVVEHP